MSSVELSSTTCMRAPRDSQHPYFMTARAVAQDTELSLDERGLLWYILSLPDDWVSHPRQLGKVNGIKGKEKIYRIFKSLMKAGYCERKNIRQNGRHHSTIYLFYEVKQQRLIDLYKEDTEKTDQVTELQESGFPVPVFPHPQKPDITNNICSTKEKKKKKRRASLSSIEFDYESRHFVNIQDSDKADWASLFPGVNVDLELGKMRQWLLDDKNPERDGNRTFIMNWLSRAQKQNSKTSPKTSPKTESPKAPKASDNPPAVSRTPYNAGIAYSILRRDGLEKYLSYLKKVGGNYYENFEKGSYEDHYLQYLEEMKDL